MSSNWTLDFSKIVLDIRHSRRTPIIDKPGNTRHDQLKRDLNLHARRGGVLPYKGYIGTCRCEEYGFQAVYSSIGYINQSIWLVEDFI